MKAQGNIIATQIGTKAKRLLVDEPKAKVWGATSRGMFLHLAPGWIIYLSSGDFPGPLTLNLEGHTGNIMMASGDVVQISSQFIIFPRIGMQIDTSQAAIWEVPPPVDICIDLDKCRLRWWDISRLAIRQLDQAGRTPSSLFQSFLALTDPEEYAPPLIGVWTPLLVDLTNALEEKPAGKVVDCLTAFLGLGNGLTPSGDDVVLGFLLALNRWGAKISPELEVESINQKLATAAYAKTTTLSANLIECAANGQANKRLVESLDGIMTGIPDAQLCAALLAGWGNSSGLDTLAGMGVAIGTILSSGRLSYSKIDSR